MAAVLNRDDYRKHTEDIFLAAAGLLKQYASGFGRMLAAMDFYVGPSKEIALIGPPQTFLSELRRRYMPRMVVAAGASERIGLLRNRPMINGQPTAYVCENFTCKQPVTEISAFQAQLSS
jgi:uncharacterized protein YyaL (SSP411 family)